MIAFKLNTRIVGSRKRNLNVSTTPFCKEGRFRGSTYISKAILKLQNIWLCSWENTVKVVIPQ